MDQDDTPLTISSDTWHYRVFDWWFQKWHMGVSYEEHYYSPSNPNPAYNLCPYVRAVVLWAPIYYLFTPPRLWYALGTLFVGLNILCYHWNGTRFLIAELTTLGLLVAIVGCVFMAYGLEHLYKKSRGLVKAQAQTSFGKLCIQYTKALHNKVCPQIKFEKTAN